MRRIVLKAFTAFACFLFMISVFLPFLSAEDLFRQIFEEVSVAVKYWSFKEAFENWYIEPLRVRIIERYFVDYWQDVSDQGLGGGVLTLMLVAQLLTVSFVNILRFKEVIN